MRQQTCHSFNESKETREEEQKFVLISCWSSSTQGPSENNSASTMRVVLSTTTDCFVCDHRLPFCTCPLVSWVPASAIVPSTSSYNGNDAAHVPANNTERRTKVSSMWLPATPFRRERRVVDMISPSLLATGETDDLWCLSCWTPADTVASQDGFDRVLCRAEVIWMVMSVSSVFALCGWQTDNQPIHTSYMMRAALSGSVEFCWFENVHGRYTFDFRSISLLIIAFVNSFS